MTNHTKYIVRITLLILLAWFAVTSIAAAITEQAATNLFG